MKQLITQYGGLKKEIYILFIGKLVTAMGSFVWPMLTFFLTTKLGLSDGVSTLLIATASILSFPAALQGGKLADRFPRKNIIILFDCLTVSLYLLSAVLPLTWRPDFLFKVEGKHGAPLMDVLWVVWDRQSEHTIFQPLGKPGVKS